MAEARKAGNAIWPQHSRNTDSTHASNSSPGRSFPRHLHQSWLKGLSRFSLRKFKSTCAVLQRGTQKSIPRGLTSSEAEKWLKGGTLCFVILTWTQEVQHRHNQAFKSSQKIPRHSGPEVSRAVSNHQQLQSLPQLHPLVSPGEPPR